MTSELPVAANVAATDRIVIVYNATGAKSTRTVNVATLAANLTFTTATPANSTANGLGGTIRYDNSYFYICVSNNVWKRTPISSW